MSLNLIIRHWSNLQTTEHAVEPSEAVSALISNLIAYYGLQDSPQDQISLATPTGTVLDPSASFIQTGVSNGDELILGPYSFVSMHKPAQAPAPVSRRVILRIREHDGRKIRLNDTDAQNLRVDDGDLVRLRDELSGTFAVGQAEIAPEVSPGEVEMDPMTMDCLGAGPDQEIVADRYPVETLKSLTQITLGIKPVGAREDQDLLIRIRSRESELARSMNRRVVINGQKFRWKEMDLIVQVLETDPPLTGEEVGMVSIDRLKGFSYRLSTDEVSFDGILLIDMSFSMEKEDLEVQNVQPWTTWPTPSRGRPPRHSSTISGRALRSRGTGAPSWPP
jgi:hypothetical protein